MSVNRNVTVPAGKSLGTPGVSLTTALWTGFQLLAQQAGFAWPGNEHFKRQERRDSNPRPPA